MWVIFIKRKLGYTVVTLYLVDVGGVGEEVVDVGVGRLPPDLDLVVVVGGLGLGLDLRPVGQEAPEAAHQDRPQGQVGDSHRVQQVQSRALVLRRDQGIIP